MGKLITKEDLECYTEKVRYYAKLCKKHKWLINRLKTVKDDEKLRLERDLRINIKEIEQFRAWILPAQKTIKTQIEKVKKPAYRTILTMRYLYLYKWSKIKEFFFNDMPDFEEEKDDKYKDKIFYWHKRALAELAKTSQEQKIALLQIKKLKALCNEVTGMKCTYKEFFNRVQTVVN